MKNEFISFKDAVSFCYCAHVLCIFPTDRIPTERAQELPFTRPRVSLWETFSLTFQGSKRLRAPGLRHEKINAGLLGSQTEKLGSQGPIALLNQNQHFCPGSKQEKALGSALQCKFRLFRKGLSQGINIEAPIRCLAHIYFHVSTMRTRLGIAKLLSLMVDTRNPVTKPDIQKLYIKEALKNKGLLLN